MKSRAVTEGDLTDFARLTANAIGTLLTGGNLTRAQLMRQHRTASEAYRALEAEYAKEKIEAPWGVELFKTIEERIRLEIEIFDDCRERAIEARLVDAESVVLAGSKKKAGK